MPRNSTLSIALFFCSLVFCEFASATNYVDSGTTTNYNLNAGDSLYIAAGTYTGNITGFASGAKITVSGAAVLQPGSLPNNANGTINVYGTFTLNSALTSNSNFTINNYGVVSLNNTVTIKGTGQMWTNNLGGFMYFGADVTISNGAGLPLNVVINYQTMNFAANLTLNSGTQLDNKKDITVSGNLKVNGISTMNNSGKLQVTGSITLNGGGVINNYCKMISSGGINNTTSTLNNYSYMG